MLWNIECHRAIFWEVCWFRRRFHEGAIEHLAKERNFAAENLPVNVEVLGLVSLAAVNNHDLVAKQSIGGQLLSPPKRRAHEIDLLKI